MDIFQFVRAIHLEQSDDVLLLCTVEFISAHRVIELDAHETMLYRKQQRELVRGLAWLRVHRPLVYERHIERLARGFAECSVDIFIPYAPIS